MGRSGEVGRGAAARWLAGWVAGVVALDPAQMVWPAPMRGGRVSSGRDAGGRRLDMELAAAGWDGSVAGGIVTDNYDMSEPVTAEYDWGGAVIVREADAVRSAGVGTGRGVTANAADRAEGKRR